MIPLGIAVVLAGPMNAKAGVDEITAEDDYVSTTQNTEVKIYAKLNDAGYDPATMRLKVVTPPRYAAKLRVGSAQNIKYLPKSGFTGRDTLVYKLVDGSGTSNQAVVTIDVSCSTCDDGQAIRAVDDFASTTKDTEVKVRAKANDSGYNLDDFAIKIVQAPKHARRISVGSAQNIKYLPARGFVGRDTFVYRLVDGSGASAEATVTVDVVCGGCEPSVDVLADAGDSIGSDATGSSGSGSTSDTGSDVDSGSGSGYMPDSGTESDVEIEGGATPAMLTLKWQANPIPVEGYVVHYGPTAGSAVLQIARLTMESGQLDPHVPYHVIYPREDLGLSAGDTACFSVQAFNVHGSSEFSDAVCTQL